MLHAAFEGILRWSIQLLGKRDLSTEQKLEDLRYLFEIIRDNHPYIELKARVEGYNWLEHEKQFEDAVRASRNDREFAQAIQRMLLMLNNGHTSGDTTLLVLLIDAGLQWGRLSPFHAGRHQSILPHPTDGRMTIKPIAHIQELRPQSRGKQELLQERLGDAP